MVVKQQFQIIVKFRINRTLCIGEVRNLEEIEETPKQKPPAKTLPGEGRMSIYFSVLL